jgi:hypothetical protein
MRVQADRQHVCDGRLRADGLSVCSEKNRLRIRWLRDGRSDQQALTVQEREYRSATTERRLLLKGATMDCMKARADLLDYLSPREA